MTNFVNALQDKIAQLEDQKGRIDEKIELLRELLDSEVGQQDVVVPQVTPKKRGRPKGVRSKTVESIHGVADELFEESTRQLIASGQGTTPELQERMIRKYKPVARAINNYGSNVRAGTKAQVDEARGAGSTSKINSKISIEEQDGPIQGE